MVSVMRLAFCCGLERPIWMHPKGESGAER
jgi:hypothetical protein